MIEQETRDEVVVLRLAHGKVNVLDLELLRAFSTRVHELAVNGAPPLVLTGAGRAFSAGVDLRRIADGDNDYRDAFLWALTTAFTTLFGYPAPTVAAVNGHAIAGGYVLAAACDHRLAAAGTGRLGLSELRVGVPFPTSAIEIVRHAAGGAVAARAALGADLLDPAAALAAGLVDEVLPPETLVDAAVALAATRAARGVDAYRLAKRQLQRPAWEAIERASPGEDAQVRTAWSEPATLDRVRAFLDTL